MQESRWQLWVRGEITPDVRSALERADIRLTGTAHGFSVGEPLAQPDHHGARLVAPSGEEALGRARTAVEGLGVSVGRDVIQLDEDD